MPLVTSGLVVQLKCDDGSGATVADSSGNGHDFTRFSSFGTNDPAWTAEGLEFVTSGTVNTIRNSSLLSGDLPLTDLTFTILCKFKSGAGPCGASSFGNWPGYDFDGSAWRMLEAGGPFMADQSHSLPTDWQVLTYSYTAGAQKIWVNDSIVDTDTLTHTYTIGSNFDIGSPNFFDRTGWELAYLLIYDRVLSDAEVEQNYQAIGLEVDPRGIVLPDIVPPDPVPVDPIQEAPEFTCQIAGGAWVLFGDNPAFSCTAVSDTAFSFKETPEFEATPTSPIRIDPDFIEAPDFKAFIALAVPEDCLTGDGIAAGESGIPNFVF
jgi:hypothetical protein